MQPKMQEKLYILDSTDCPKNFTIGIWVSIAKEPFMESEKSNQIYETMTIFSYNSVKTPSDLASSHKEIWIFVK